MIHHLPNEESQCVSCKEICCLILAIETYSKFVCRVQKVRHIIIFGYHRKSNGITEHIDGYS